MADYHDERHSWFLDEKKYPSKDQQKNFVRAYVEHNAPNWDNEEEMDAETKKIMEEADAWRAGCNAVWAVWGMVQGKAGQLPDIDDANEWVETVVNTPNSPNDDPTFDYISYARHKALLFWGDVQRLNLIQTDIDDVKVIV